MRYRDAGVDVTRSDSIKERLLKLVQSTWTDRVCKLPRGFAGLMAWPGSSSAAGDEPAGGWVAATMDGVGTKLLLAQKAGRLAEAAADLVYHGANDLLAHGAQPLAFLDYIAQERLDPDVVLTVVEGLSHACREVGAVLLGGETAEMPDTYRPGVVDVAGCMIGRADPRQVLDGRSVQAGDLLLGIASTGLHTNGYSLARRILDKSGLSLDDALPHGNGERVGARLLAPHRWYGPCLAIPLAEGRIKALAHVTGGGIAANLGRVLPPGVGARVVSSNWERPSVFRWLIEAGSIPETDAREAFNLGIGMVAVVSPEHAPRTASDVEGAGERVMTIGSVVAGAPGVEWMDD